MNNEKEVVKASFSFVGSICDVLITECSLW